MIDLPKNDILSRMIKDLQKRNIYLKKTVILGFLLLFTSFPANAEVEFFPSATSTLDFATTSNVVDFEVKTSTENNQPEEVHIPEPKIRVGIYKTDKKVIFTAPTQYILFGGDADLGIIPENEVATITYLKGVYSFSSPSITVTSSEYFRLVPGDLSEYFTLVNLDRRLNARSQLSFNTYRGIFEYRYSPKSKMPYIINELLLENYVAGIAETSNGAPEEYIKALQIAARSYAYANISSEPPSEKRMFDVYANTNDQLYLGYNFESFSPKIAFFTAGTRGLMVTYNGKVVPTYYFSRSNGQTKTRKSQPWLKSVIAKYDKGKGQLGHGYGMSNQDAAARAKKDGWTYDKILKYYYSDVEIKKIFD